MTRTALVTGGASGLGAATAARLRADGLTVTTLDISGPADVIADVTDEAALRTIANETGPVDVLINSAGIVGAIRAVAQPAVPAFLAAAALQIGAMWLSLQPALAER